MRGTRVWKRLLGVEHTVIESVHFDEDANLVVRALIPVSQMGGTYRVNPEKDMRPLCANCHAAVHTQDPPLTPQALRKRLIGG